MSAIDSAVKARIIESRERQIAKWGKQDHEDCVWFTIVLEELGEAAQAWKRDVHSGEHSMEAELTSVASMVIQWLERIEERKVPDREGA